MPYSLLCPNQLRHNGLIVKDTPRVYDPSSTHSIIIPGKLNLPLKMRGVMSYLLTRKPSEEELLSCERFELTSAECWEPHKTISGHDNEEVEGTLFLESKGRLYAQASRDPVELDRGLSDRFIQTLQISRVDEIDGSVHHEADVIAYGGQCRDLHVINSQSRQSIITEECLAQRWFTGLEAAKRTLRATTQEGMRFVDGPIERRLKTSQAHLRFPTLIITLYFDTLFSHVRSVRGHTCAQIFTDGHGFVRVHPMKNKSEAHHALMRFIHEVRVPKNLLTDRAPEEMRGEWGQIVKKI
jgi:hypothetical protein